MVGSTMKRLSVILLVWGISDAKIVEADPDVPAECASAPEDMKCIPAGDFIRGADDDAKDQRPKSTIYISTFFMDTYEVTNGDFKECVKAGVCRKGAGPAYKG